MSFDIFFQPRRQSSERVEGKNPFTGETISGSPSVPLTAAELKAVRQVLKKSKARGPDDFGCYVVEFEDGGSAEIFADDLSNGCMAALRGLTPDLLCFLFDMLVAADWIMLPAMKDNPAITSSVVGIEWLSDGFLKVVCGSPEELGVILDRGVEAWKRYLDQVLERD